jgi:hypothetical protein
MDATTIVVTSASRPRALQKTSSVTTRRLALDAQGVCDAMTRACSLARVRADKEERAIAFTRASVDVVTQHAHNSALRTRVCQTAKRARTVSRVELDSSVIPVRATHRASCKRASSDQEPSWVLDLAREIGSDSLDTRRELGGSLE